CAVALISNSSASWGARGAAALLALFIAAISINLARGRRPDCHCFGQLSSSPVSAQTLVRNAVLLALAVLIAWKGRDNPGGLPSFAGWTPFESATVAVAVALVLIAALTLWLLAHVLRQNGR